MKNFLKMFLMKKFWIACLGFSLLLIGVFGFLVLGGFGLQLLASGNLLGLIPLVFELLVIVFGVGALTVITD